MVRLGLVTDVHHARKPPSGTRHYDASLRRLEAAVRTLRSEGASFLVELGDFVDSAPTAEEELGYLREVDRVWRGFGGPVHYVLGNHCVQALTKDEFLHAVGAPAAHHSFDRSGYHFIVLDACYRADGVGYHRGNFRWTDTDIPEAQRAWLEADLAGTDLPTVVFVHQRLDLEPPSHYLVRSAAEVRGILEASGKVAAVLQGHHHVNDHRWIRGIHYCTLPALVDGPPPTSNAFGLLELFTDGSLRLHGFARTASYSRATLLPRGRRPRGAHL